MATSSVSSNSSTTTTNTSYSSAGIDVAGIVAGLMTVENKPLVALQSTIANKNLLISDLGQLKSKLSAFQTTLQAVESSSSYSSAVASSSNESAVTVTSSNGSVIGSHQIHIDQLAKPAQFIFNVFGTSKDSVGFSNGTFDLTVAGVTNHLSVSGNTTIQDVSTWINGLGLDVAANITQTTSNPDKFALIIQGTKSGLANAVSFGVQGASGDPPLSSSASLSISPPSGYSGSQAQDATFTLDGVDFSRSTNNVTDVLTGTTFNLVSSGITATVSLAKGPDKGPEVVQSMVTAFNDIVALSKKLTQKSDSSSSGGSLAGSPQTISFINQIKSMLAIGATYKSGGVSKTLGLYQLGIEMQLDGTLSFNSAKYGSGSSDNISSILSSGIKLGSTDFSDQANNLSAFLTSMIQTGGTFTKSISNEQNNLDVLNKKQEDLQTRLDSKQKNFINQYSSLNALLFKLSNTSSALTSALGGLVSGQNNK